MPTHEFCSFILLCPSKKEKRRALGSGGNDEKTKVAPAFFSLINSSKDTRRAGGESALCGAVQRGIEARAGSLSERVRRATIAPLGRAGTVLSCKGEALGDTQTASRSPPWGWRQPTPSSSSASSPSSFGRASSPNESEQRLPCVQATTFPVCSTSLCLAEAAVKLKLGSEGSASVPPTLPVSFLPRRETSSLPPPTSLP